MHKMFRFAAIHSENRQGHNSLNHQDCTLVCSQEDNKRQEAAVKAVAAAAGVLADPPFPYHSIRDRSKEELVVVRRFELPH